ncbi:hypothetical protein HID58_041823 [Brassica napus]|uniref:Uncharacterized protein n=2 Tax=Brassica TaxID=3705 RepID=A0ABQ8BDH8_BRANA|nr:hypothetical protein HID58_041823 [Brassica napus]
MLKEMNSFLDFSGLGATTSIGQTLDLCHEKRPTSYSYFICYSKVSVFLFKLNSFEIVSGNAIAEIGRLLMFEASREWLPMVVGEIMTPVGAASVELIERISFGSVLQACLMPCVHSVASVSQHRSICVKGNLVMKGNLFLRYVPHSLANSLDKLVWMHLLAVAGATIVSSSFGKDEKMAKSEVAVATTLADALYMKDDEVIAAKREHLALRRRDSQSMKQ